MQAMVAAVEITRYANRQEQDVVPSLSPLTYLISGEVDGTGKYSYTHIYIYTPYFTALMLP